MPKVTKIGRQAKSYGNDQKSDDFENIV